MGYALTFILIAWVVFNYLFDDTRVGHPDYKKSNSYANCLQIGNDIYNERMSEARADPSTWKLSGYESASDYARSGQSVARRQCD